MGKCRSSRAKTGRQAKQEEKNSNSSEQNAKTPNSIKKLETSYRKQAKEQPRPAPSLVFSLARS